MSWFAELAFSPMVSVQDKDQHLLRNLVITGDFEGEAIRYQLGVSFGLGSKGAILLAYDNLKIETDGKHSFSENGLSQGSIYAENRNEQETISLSFRMPLN